jgi:hypothetical protein
VPKTLRIVAIAAVILVALVWALHYVDVVATLKHLHGH